MTNAYTKKRVAERENFKPNMKRKRNKSKAIMIVGTILAILDIVVMLSGMVEQLLGVVILVLIFCSMIGCIWMIYEDKL